MHSLLTLSFPVLLPLVFCHCKNQLDVLGHIYIYKCVLWQSEMLEVVCVYVCVSEFKCVFCGLPSGMVSNHRLLCQTTLRFTSRSQAKKSEELIISISRLLCKVWNSFGLCELCEFLWIWNPSPLQCYAHNNVTLQHLTTLHLQPNFDKHKPKGKLAS